ncbi:MAG TPA: DUF1893 domain-containing protein [Halanaerobiales bacterium]|nr:DUF1893 domain-containing protein [Halanaerobiales bacterium]
MNDKELAINELNDSDYSLIIVKEKEVKYKSKEESVGSIVSLLEEQPDLLENAVVADKIIGRAVAMVCDYASVKFCYGQIVSEGAIDIFNKNHLSFKASQKVKAIKNRDNTDLCPIEKLTLNIDNSAEGIKKIKEFLKN